MAAFSAATVAIIIAAAVVTQAVAATTVAAAEIKKETELSATALFNYEVLIKRSL